MTPELAAFLANLILILHALLATFVVGGWLVTVVGGLCRWQWVRSFWFRVLHLLVVGVIVLESVFGMVCPLTRWEEQLRSLAGQEGTDELEQLGFLLYYLRRILFLPDHWEWSQTVLMWVYIAFGVGVLATWIFFPPRWSRRRSGVGKPPSDVLNAEKAASDMPNPEKPGSNALNGGKPASDERNAGRSVSDTPNAGKPGSDALTNTAAPSHHPLPSQT